MSPNLSNQVALVTGAGRGIGRAIAIALARCRAHVVLAARTESELRRVADEMGGNTTILSVDLTDELQITRAFSQLPKLDILINNAGIGLFGKVQDLNTSDLDQMLAVNVRAPFLCCREALRKMIPVKSGYIINIASVVGFKGYVNQAGYGATKHAVMGLTKSLAVECQPHNIRVSAVLPGGVNAGMSGAARPDLPRDVLMSADDVANAVLYLLALGPTNAAVDQIYIRRKVSQPF